MASTLSPKDDQHRKDTRNRCDPFPQSPARVVRKPLIEAYGSEPLRAHLSTRHGLRATGLKQPLSGIERGPEAPKRAEARQPNFFLFTALEPLPNSPLGFILLQSLKGLKEVVCSQGVEKGKFKQGHNFKTPPFFRERNEAMPRARVQAPSIKQREGSSHMRPGAGTQRRPGDPRAQ
jgi:hypothetical protein